MQVQVIFLFTSNFINLLIILCLMILILLTLSRKLKLLILKLLLLNLLILNILVSQAPSVTIQLKKLIVCSDNSDINTNDVDNDKNETLYIESLLIVRKRYI